MKTVRRKRADQLLVEHALVSSRQKAQQLISQGDVYANAERVRKSGQLLDEDAVLALNSDTPQWVSRAGQKLSHAFEHFPLGDITGAVCADIGASTGGFSEVLLHHGAGRIYAVDVGTDQLAPALATDSRICNLQQLNVRELTTQHIPQPLDLVVSDLSFISVTKALMRPMEMVRHGGQLVCLVKPQFEVGRAHIGKKGIVKSAEAHQMALQTVSHFIESQPGWQCQQSCVSPITGSGGNTEFLLHATKTA